MKFRYKTIAWMKAEEVPIGAGIAMLPEESLKSFISNKTLHGPSSNDAPLALF